MCGARVTRTASAGATNWTGDGQTILPADGTQMLASVDPERQAVTIINDALSLGDLWVVPASQQNRGGVRIAPGAGLPLNTTAPVYGYALGGQVQAFTVTETGVAC